MTVRGRNQVQQSALASQPARLPALPSVPSGLEPAVRQFLEAVRERLEVREGARGNPFEAVVTKRDLVEAGLVSIVGGRTGGAPAEGAILILRPDGTYAQLSVDEFAARIFKLPLYQNLLRRLDDPARFDALPEEVRSIVVNSIADEAAKRGADIRSVEYKLQSTERSLAFRVDEVSAAVTTAAAGVRETVFAVATDQRAQAGKVEQLEVSLGNYYQDGTPGRANLEVSMTATADRTDGLAAEYMVKLNAGRAVAGFGLAASEDPSGDTESAFIVQADKFALTSTYTFVQEATPSATAAGQTWYKPSTEVSYRSTGTGTGNWTTYTPVVPFGVDTVTGTVYINGQVRINAGGTPIQDIESGLDAAGFSVSASSLVFAVTRAGVASPTSLAFSHQAQNLPAGLRVRYTSSPSISGFNGVYYNVTDSPSLAYSALSSALGSANVATITATLYNAAGNNTPYTSGGTGFVESITLARLYEGSGVVQALLSNPTHTFTANAAGTVTTYAESGTEIRVYEGTVELTYDGVGSAAGTWAITSSASGITRGALTDSGLYVTVGDHSAMTGDAASITYTVAGKDRLGNAFSFPVKQTFSKGKAGAEGQEGERGSLTGYAAASSAAWSSLTALVAIETMLGIGPSGAFNSTTAASLRIGDTVTLTFTGWAETRYWSGAYSATNTDANRNGWLKPGVVIDGNLLVNGTVSANALTAGTVTVSGAHATIGINTTPENATGSIPLSISRSASTSRPMLHLTDTPSYAPTAQATPMAHFWPKYAGLTISSYGLAGAAGSAVHSVFEAQGTGVYGFAASGFWKDAALYGYNSFANANAHGVYGAAVTGYGGVFVGNATNAPLKLELSTSKPTNAGTGGVMLYNDGGGVRLCVAIAGTWYKIDATLTAI